MMNMRMKNRIGSVEQKVEKMEQEVKTLKESVKDIKEQLWELREAMLRREGRRKAEVQPKLQTEKKESTREMVAEVKEIGMKIELKGGAQVVPILEASVESKDEEGDYQVVDSKEAEEEYRSSSNYAVGEPDELSFGEREYFLHGEEKIQKPYLIACVASDDGKRDKSATSAASDDGKRVKHRALHLLFLGDDDVHGEEGEEREMTVMEIGKDAEDRMGIGLLGKVALVTGGATGIGESIVRLFHIHGAKVCLVDVQDNLGKRVCESLGSDTNACFFHCDVSVEDDVRTAVDFTVSKFGTLDIIVNNAGVSGSPCPDIRDADLSEFDKVFNINVKGVFHGMKHAARIMIPSKKGSIISLSSVASTTGGLGPHAYTGSKHAVWGLTKNVAAELGKHGIRVNCVSPYCVPTSLALAHLPEEERTEDALAGFRAFVGTNANLQGVELTANDVANAVLFLASDDSRYVSGANLMIDGGFTTVNHSLRVFR